VLHLRGAKSDADRLALGFGRRADPGLIYTVEAPEDLATATAGGWRIIWKSQGGENIPGPVTIEDCAFFLENHDLRFLRMRIGIQP